MTREMTLEEEQIALLRGTPLLAHGQSEKAATVFYETLFEQNPKYRELFPEQMSDQRRKFSATLAVAVNTLTDWETLAPVLESLARRHLNYGVTRADYDNVAEALITTLKTLDCDDADIRAWTSVYGTIADHMIATAYPAKN